MQTRMVAIDLDGTLIHSSGIVTERNLRALRSAKAAGLEVVIATGRRHSYAMRILRNLSLDAEDIVLSSNGTVARTVGARLLFRRSMPIATARQLCDVLHSFRDGLVLTFDLVTPGGEDTLGSLVLEEIEPLHNSIQAWIEANRPYIRRVSPLSAVLTGPDATPPIQAMLCGNMHRMAEAETLLRDALGEQIDIYRTEYPGKDLCIVDLMPQGCSKGSGLLRVAASHGITSDEIMTIGDNWNDVPMLQMAGRAVLMANAPDRLRQLAAHHGWEVGASHDDDGVAEAIESVLG